jgi:hypothetical protein
VWTGNQIYLIAGLMAHNRGRELQMCGTDPERSLSDKRPALWAFSLVSTLRRELIQRAWHFIRRQGQLTLSMSANAALKNRMFQILDALDEAAQARSGNGVYATTGYPLPTYASLWQLPSRRTFSMPIGRMPRDCLHIRYSVQ